MSGCARTTICLTLLIAASASLPIARAEQPPDRQQPAAPGQPPPDTSTADAERARLEADIARELGGTASAPATAPQQPPAAAQQAEQRAATGGNPLARVLLLPDVSAIGSGALTWNDYGGDVRSHRDGPWSDPRRVTPVFEELELGLQAVVDPYARADVFLSFSEGGASVEEAYLTALTLPAGLVARAGRFFAPFGRINPQHPHTWEFVDRPLAWQRLLAPEAFGGAGVAVAWLAPLPWFAELHLAYQGVAPAPVALTDLADAPTSRAATARLIQFVDLSERLSVGAGLSGTLVESLAGWRDVAGADLFVKYRPGATRAYVAVQAEALSARMRDVAGGRSGWGTYAQAVYHPEAHWGFGARWERAPGFASSVLGGVEQRWNALASWAPSEFQRYRLQAGWTRVPGGGDGLEALLAMEFAIGAHGAHPF